MFNVKFKFVWTICLLLVSMAITAQEICDNGIDDDGDTFIDLNDDECDCSTVVPLTLINGSLCRRLDLELTYPGATSYQWYKNGIAIVGETSARISISRWAVDPLGDYEVLVEHPSGCVISEVYVATQPDYFTDLGDVALCEGDTLYVAGVPFSKKGFQRFKTVATDGCDSTIVFVILFINTTTDRINDVMCTGGTYVNGGIVATTPGVYLDTIVSGAGCDSLIRRVDLTFEDLPPIQVPATICAGETYRDYGLEETTSGQHTVTVSGTCDTTFIIDLVVSDKIEESIDASICEGGLFELGDISTSTAGQYETKLLSINGCDSLVKVNLVIDDLAEYRFPQTICQGKIFEQGDISTGEPGEHSYVSTTGVCDSLIIIELTVTAPEQMMTDETICQGKSIEWRGTTYDTEGVFTDLETTAGECDIEHILNLSFEAVPENIETQTICEGQVYSWMGNDYDTADRYEELVKTPGECDVLEVLQLMVTEPLVEQLAETICDGQIYEFGDIKEDSSGVYTTTISEPGVCDITYEVTLTVFDNTAGLVESTLCNGDIFELYDLTATTPGSYVANTTNMFGCDSTINVELTAGALDPVIIEESICPGDVVIFQGDPYDTEGDHSVTLVAESGCDSIVTLRLAINAQLAVSYDETICEGETYELHGLSESTTGTYDTVVVTGTGCDSLVTLNLTVLEKTYHDFNAQICDGDMFTEVPGIEATEEGSYMTTLTNSAGCDSIVTFTLSVLTEEPHAFTVEICEGDTYTNNNIIATEAGRYEDQLISSAGCDSFIVVALQVLPLNQRVEELKICPGDVVSFYGQDLTEAGSYTERISNENGCDSVVTYNIELNSSVGDIEVQDTVLVNLGSTVDIEPTYVDESFIAFQWIDSEENILSLDRVLADYSPADDTYLDFLAINEFGCEIRERINIDVELIVDIYVPNVMEPDKGDLNSNFSIGGNESVVGIEDLRIYDRWGELLYIDSHEGRLITYVGWDGEYKGKTVKSGVYTYAAVFNIIDGSFVKKAGSVTVIR